MTIPILGQPKLDDLNPIAEFLARFQEHNNTHRQDRQALAALILVVDGMLRKQMEADGINVEDKIAELKASMEPKPVEQPTEAEAASNA
jgi:hypothetical protein